MIETIKETFETSTQEEYEKFKQTLGQNKKSNSFEDFMADIRNG